MKTIWKNGLLKKLAGLSLVAVLIAGDLVAMPVIAGQAEADALATAQININQADAETIAMAIKGIGSAKAEAIVKYREEHGPFQSVDELMDVKGIGPATLEKNRSLIVVE